MYKRIIAKILCIPLTVAILFCASAWCISGLVQLKTKSKIHDIFSAEDTPYDCILVLGCRVYADGRMSPMLHDRMQVAVGLMKQGASDRLLVSGDHATDAYNEVAAMKSYAIEQGIPSSSIFEDHDGYSTYDSIARLKTVYGAKRVLIVTQRYHLYRAIYLAESMGMEAVGVSADLQSYAKQPIYDLREIFARCKDVYLSVRKPAPAGDLTPIPLEGDGDMTVQSRPVQ